MTRRTPYQLDERKGRAMWRSLDEKYADPKTERREAEAERAGGFLGHANLIDASSLMSRRSMLKASTLAAAAAGVSGCIRRPAEEIFPYSHAPENLIPGVPSHFATVMQQGRDALGVVVTSHDGRPTKVEGNALHPASRGATNVQAQTYVWDLYDPDRSKSPQQRGSDAPISYDAFDKAFGSIAKSHAADLGAGLQILAPIQNSPSFRKVRAAVLKRFPKATFHTYSSVNDDNARNGAKIAFGKPLAVIPNLAAAKVIVSLDSDFLGDEPGAVRAARGFGKTRAISTPAHSMSRLYVVESNHSVTGASADHRLRLGASDVGRYAAALTSAVHKKAGGLGGVTGALKGDTTGVPSVWIDAVAADLVANRGRSIVLAGSAQPPHVHALAHALNAALANVGRTLTYAAVADENYLPSVQGIASFVAALPTAKTALMLGGNPAYDAPADLNLAQALGRQGLTSIHLSSRVDETSALCSWHVPIAHELASWGDHRSLDGTLSVQQPLVAPLYGGRSAIEMLAALAGSETRSGYDIVRESHRSTSFGSDQNWRNALYMGLASSGRPAANAQLREDRHFAEHRQRSDH